jgi:hypothetical protein
MINNIRNRSYLRNRTADRTLERGGKNSFDDKP